MFLLHFIFTPVPAETIKRAEHPDVEAFYVVETLDSINILPLMLSRLQQIAKQTTNLATLNILQLMRLLLMRLLLMRLLMRLLLIPPCAYGETENKKALDLRKHVRVSCVTAEFTVIHYTQCCCFPLSFATSKPQQALLGVLMPGLVIQALKSLWLLLLSHAYSSEVRKPSRSHPAGGVPRLTLVLYNHARVVARPFFTHI